MYINLHDDVTSPLVMFASKILPTECRMCMSLQNPALSYFYLRFDNGALIAPGLNVHVNCIHDTREQQRSFE